MANKNRWFIPTNTDNLRMIIAQGLISSPKGFKKYYSDVLELSPGYVPLFRNRIQPDILKYVTMEVDGLTPCILEIDLKKIEGMGKTIDSDNLTDILIKDIEQENSDISFLLAPIPISCISKVIFKTIADKKDFERDAELYNNVPIKTMKLHYTKIDQKLFEAKPDITDCSIEKLKIRDIDIDNSVDYDKVYAYGGMISNLFYFAKNGTISNRVFISCISAEEISDFDDISYVFNYFYNAETTDNKNDLYNNIVDLAIRSRNFKESIIEFLESDSRTAKIAYRLKNFETISDKPVSEEFYDAKTLLGRVLLMLFHREDTEALMEYTLDFFAEEEYLAFAMLFGIRDKFIKIPKFLRESGDLQNFISTKMANYAHRSVGSQIDFKESRRPLTIMDMLKNSRFKEYFAKELKIEKCFQTVIPKSDYKVIKGKPVFEGVVMPKFEILEEEYFKSISQQILIDYNKYLEKYNKIK